MSRQFERKVAVVTGGGNGIGLATAEAFAREGAAVLVADVNAEAARHTAESIGRSGGRAVSQETDVAAAHDVERMVGRAVSEFGRVDFLVNNAGISGFIDARMCDMDESLFDRLVATNIKGVWLGMKHAIPVMIGQGGGIIVNVASTLGLVGQRLSGPYAATKHAVIGLTKTAAIEYGLDGIRINAICPGGIETPIAERFKATFSDEDWRQRNATAYPATGRFGQAGEIASVAMFLCSDAASNIHGTAIVADGGYTAQ